MRKGTIKQRIAEIRHEIKTTPYHKGTEHHIGRLRARIARLEDRLLRERLRKSHGHSGGEGYAVAKSGDATVVLVGFPSVGKSTLLNVLSNARSKVGSYPFTTLKVVPGIMEYRGAKIQILDVPGLMSGAAQGRGGGKEVLSVVRMADLIIILVDYENLDRLGVISNELENVAIRVDKQKPAVLVNKRSRGGILIKGARLANDFDAQMAIDIAMEMGLKNAEIVISEASITQKEFIDALLGNRVYIPSITIIGKSDLLQPNEVQMVKKRFPSALFISSNTGEGIRKLREEIFKKLGLIRIFLKPRGKRPDFSEPLIIKKGTTVADVAKKVGRIPRDKRSAHIWGKSAKYPGQLVGEDHFIQDEDIVSF